MKTINIHVAKTHFSQLVEEAALVEEIVIVKAGKPMARLVALDNQVFDRAPGRLQHPDRNPREFRRSCRLGAEAFGIDA